MTDASAIREDEIQVLESIFQDDWKCFPPTKSPWGTLTDEGTWRIVLRVPDLPSVGITIKGNFPKGYPKFPAQITLEDPKNLSPDHVKQLQKVLQETAKAKVGEAMVYEITDICQDWIRVNHLKLPEEYAATPNLMEQKAQREQAQKDAKEARLQAERQQQAAREAEQKRLLSEQIQLDATRKTERAKMAEQHAEAQRKQEILSSLADGELDSRLLQLDEEVQVEGYQGSWKTWMLFGGKREDMWTTYSAEPNVASGSRPQNYIRATLPTVAVHVVDFSSTYYSTHPDASAPSQGTRKVDALANEVMRLREVRCENVVRVLAVKRGKSPKGWERLMIMTDSVGEGGRLKGWLPRDGFGETLARTYLAQLLRGLSEIHRNKSLQKQIDTDHVLLCANASGDSVVKLCGTSFARRIGDLHLSNPFLRTHRETTVDSWKSPEELESPHDYSPRRDIWEAGLLFLQLIFGQHCLLVYPNLDAMLQHAPLSDSTVRLIRSMLLLNPKRRFSAEEAIASLKQHESEVSGSATLGRSAPSDAPLASPSDILGTSPNAERPGGSFPQTNSALRSRYRAEYQELEYLGKGGFGEVVKAKNKLDDKVYAIKKIKLRHGDDEQRVYREVKTMAGVSHQHIVRYHACWLEEVEPVVPETESESGDEAARTETPGTEDEDIFKFDMNDLSFSSRDRSRSASFPSVRFANDEDDENDDESTSSSDSDTGSDDTVPDPSSRPPTLAVARGRTQAKPSISVTDTTSEAHNVKTILYIAMEYVEKQTLRELILGGLTEEEGWTLLKQILDALAHLAKEKIVHRDLKPSNILINSRNQVKIADFGLSTTDMSAVDPLQMGSHELVGAELDRTSNIGTGLYIAPEVAVSRSYNEKADMYSLGIIFFEMCHRFNTHMERAQILTALRLPPVVFPPNWAGKVDQRQVITMLLQHDPVKRPTAEQLLRDPLVPSPERDQQKYAEVISEIANPSSAHYPQLILALFEPEPRQYSAMTDTRLDDYTYDNDYDPAADLQIWITVVQQRLVQLFQRHGAVETHLPLLIPDTSLLSAFRPSGQPAKLLDSSGKLTRLPSSNLLGMARNATRRHIERIKRYHIGERYDAKIEGQPDVQGELSFDIVSPIRSLAAEAELLDLMDKVLGEFKGGRNPALADYELHVSHEGVLATMLAAVPEKHRADVGRIFTHAGSAWTTDSKMRLSSLSGIPRPLQDDIDQCCHVDDFPVVRTKLENVFTSASSRRRLHPALMEIEDVLKLAQAAGVSRRILFRPSMSRHADYFRGGFMFEVVHRKSKDLLAHGGRYDALLSHFKDPARELPSRQVYGVGMSLSTDTLALTVKKYESAISERLMNRDVESERSFGFWTPARCDVYIVDAGLDLAGRMTLTGELWRAGIRADMQYDDERTQLEVERECVEQNTLFLLVPRANRQSVKVRPILKKGSEVDVPRNELIAHLRQAILEQRRIDAGHAQIDPVGGIGHGAALSGDQKDADPKVKLVLPPEPQSAKEKKGKGGGRKHRHPTKSIYYEKAEEFVSRVGTHLPVVAIDLEPSLISRLTLSPSWVNEDEAWRVIMSEIKSSERKYADMVRVAVRDAVSGAAASGGGVGALGGISMGGSGGGGGLNSSIGSGGGPGAGGQGEGDKGGNGWVWLFSVREGRGFLLQIR